MATIQNQFLPRLAPQLAAVVGPLDALRRQQAAALAAYLGGSSGGSSGGYSGGYSAPEPAPPPPPPRMDDDPQFQMFMAEINAQRANADAERQRQEGFVNANRDMALADLTNRNPLERTNIMNAQESRGVFRSSATEEQLARQASSMAQRQNALDLQTRQRISDVQAQLAQQVANLNAQIAQARMQYAGQGFV